MMNQLSEGSIVTDGETSNNKYFLVSCKPCRSSHRKCDRALPSCSTCVKRGVECCYNPPKKRGRQSPTPSNRPSKRQRVDFNQTQIPVPLIIKPYVVKTEQKATTIPSANITTAPTSIIDAVEANYVAFQQQHVNTTVAEQATKTLYYAIRAVSLYNIPSGADPQQNKYIASDYFAHGCSHLSLFDADFSDLSDLVTVITKFSRSEIQKAAFHFYEVAKQNLLDSRLFSHISTNAKLAEASLCLVYYVLARNRCEELQEARLFLGLVSVFLDSVSGSAHIDMSQFSGTESEKADHYSKVIESIRCCYCSASMLTMMSNSYQTKGYTSREHLEQVLGLLLSSLDTSKITLLGQFGPVIANSFRTLLGILRNESGVSRLLRFIETCNKLSDTIAVVPLFSDRPAVYVFWKLVVMSLELWIACIESANHLSDTQLFHIAKDLKIDYAHKISKFALENTVIVQIVGIYFIQIILKACQIHNNRAALLISERFMTGGPVTQILSYLKADRYLLETIGAKYEISELVTMLNRTTAQMELTNLKLQAFSNPQQPLSLPQYSAHLPISHNANGNNNSTGERTRIDPTQVNNMH